MDECCVVAHDETGLKGRQLIAKRKLDVGTLVLKELPYACVLNTEHVPHRCDCCLAAPDPSQSQELLRCKVCRAAFYMDREHQQKAWRAGHREECKVLSGVGLHGLPPVLVRLALRVALKAHRNNGLHLLASDRQEDQTHPDRASSNAGLATVVGLLSHWHSLSDASKITFARYGAWAYDLLRRGCPAVAGHVTPRDLTMLVARFSCNNHAICDDELRPIGLGVYPMTAMANHSCQPSCIQTFGSVNGELFLRAVRDIPVGEELSISYVDSRAPRWHCRAQLLEEYHFDIDRGVLPQSEERIVSTITTKEVRNGKEVLIKHMHYRSDVPPWPHDGRRDIQLTAVGRGNAFEVGAWGRILPLPPISSIDEQRGHASHEGKNPVIGEAYAEERLIEIFTWSTDPYLSAAIERFTRSFATALLILHFGAVPSNALEQIRDLLCGNGLEKYGLGESDETLVLGPHHVVRFQLQAALLDGNVEACRWQDALALARDLLPLYEWAYTPVWPALALHLARLAKLEHLVGDTHRAVAAAERARAMLEATAAPRSRAAQEMNRICLQANAELSSKDENAED